MNKIVELEVQGMNAAADILADVRTFSAARMVREGANNYARATEQRDEFKAMLKAIVDSPTPDLFRKARKMVEEA